MKMSHTGTSTVHVQLLDNSIHKYYMKAKSYANTLYQAVIKDLNLIEADYFGIQYTDKFGRWCFLDPLKKIKTQIHNINNVVLKFVVKFFPPDPGQLEEEYTKYLFALQVKQDISNGMLPYINTTLSVLASYIAQSEFGDWNTGDCSDLLYITKLKILPSHCANELSLLAQISELHKSYIGQTASEADGHLLDMARKLEFYGIRMHPAMDQDNTNISLSVAHLGVLVFRDNTKVNTFNWSTIRKLSFKKKRFLIKLKPELSVDGKHARSGDVLVFVMLSRNACKTFWRLCLEHHAFFRLDVRPEPKPQPVLLKRGSTFRYSGKTQKQLQDIVRHRSFRRTTFTRASGRTTSTQRSNLMSHQLQSASERLDQLGTGESCNIAPTKDKSNAGGNGDITVKTDASGCPTARYNVLAEKPDASSELQETQNENIHRFTASVNRKENHEHETASGEIQTTFHVPSNDNNKASTNQIALQNPDILNDVDGRSPFNDEFVDADPTPLNTDSVDSPTTPPAPYLSKHILAIESVSSSSKSSRSNSTARLSGGSSRRPSSLPLPPPPPPPPEEIVEDDLPDPPIEENVEVFVPPPLPPKLSASAHKMDRVSKSSDATNSNHESTISTFVESSEVSSHMKPSFAQTVNLQGSSTSSSPRKVTAHGLEGREPRDQNQHIIIEQDMMGVEDVPVLKKPPIPPTAQPKSKEELESDIDRALNELDCVTQSLNRDSLENPYCDKRSSGSSHNGMYGVVIDSEDSVRSSPKNSSLDHHLLSPIQMKFDDQYLGPDYHSADALSSFAMEMEASFDRIRQSMSNERLDERPRDSTKKSLSSSRGVLHSTPQSPHQSCHGPSYEFTQRKAPTIYYSHANNNRNQFSSSHYMRRESDDTVDL